MPLPALALALAANTAAAAPDDNVLVVDLDDGASVEAAALRLGLPGLRLVHPRAVDEALAVVALEDAAAVARAAARVSAAAGVEVAEPLIPFVALGGPDDPAWPRQWNLRSAGAPAGWRAGAGAGVRVAVLDTGIAPVPDLAGARVRPGASFVDGVASPLDGNGHGTHVAGTIAQVTNNGRGVAGMSPAVELVPIKVLSDDGFGTSAWIAAGIDEAVDQGAQVINLSLGGPPSAVVALAVRKATAAGVLVVAAAGNSGGPGLGSPAADPGAVAVAALGPSGARAPYSSTGPEVDIAAPGGDLRVADGGVLQDTVIDGGGLAALQGTSMAAPHVSAALAAIIGFGVRPADATAAVLGTARPIEGAAAVEVGAGGLDLGAALSSVARRAHLPRALLAALAAAALLPRGAGTGARIAVASVAAGAAGVGAVLVSAPLPYGGWTAALASPPLLWGSRLFHGAAAWVVEPAWASAILPFAAVFALGPHRVLGPLAGAAALGWGAHLAHAAWSGRVALGALGEGALGSGWLGINAVVALFAAFAAFGVARLRARTEA